MLLWKPYCRFKYILNKLAPLVVVTTGIICCMVVHGRAMCTGLSVGPFKLNNEILKTQKNVHEVVELPGLRTALLFLSCRNAVSRPPWKTVCIQAYDGRSLRFPKTQLRVWAGPSVAELKDDDLQRGGLRGYGKTDLTNLCADFIWHSTPAFHSTMSSR